MAQYLRFMGNGCIDNYTVTFLYFSTLKVSVPGPILDLDYVV